MYCNTGSKDTRVTHLNAKHGQGSQPAPTLALATFAQRQPQRQPQRPPNVRSAQFCTHLLHQSSDGYLTGEGRLNWREQR
jgi:hypothetical protein